jgi:hypothetical protein
VLGVSLVGNDRRFVESSLDEVLSLIHAKAEVMDVQKELQTFNDADPLSVGEPPYKHWEPKD